jgi:hypothetical protein
MEFVIYIVLIGLGMLFGYVIGFGRNLSDIEAEYEKVTKEHLKIVDSWQKEYLKLYEKYRALQDGEKRITVRIDEDVK